MTAVLDRAHRPAPAREHAVAIVHDYLTQRGGAERVVLSMLEAFPQAPLYTSLYLPEATFPEFRTVDVRTLPLNRIRLFRRFHRLALPFYPASFTSLKIDADVVLCSSSGWAHGVRATGRKIVYCYSPARWLYQSDRYLGDGASVSRAALALLRPLLRRWDARVARTADRYVTLSTVVRERIEATYGLQADIVPLPQTIDVGGRQRRLELEPGFWLCASRLLPYKNVDAVVGAFADLPQEQLVVAGDGPERGRLEVRAGANVRFVGVADDETMRWLYASSAGLIAASHEDFGLTPLEANAFGRPALVLRAGGFLDTTDEGVSGLFFDEPSPAAVATAIRQARDHPWSTAAIEANAGRYEERRFIEGLRAIVSSVMDGSE